MSINTREDANRYYQVINGLVDDYIDKWKIRPSSLKRYLQPGSERFNKFLERNKLKDVKGAEVILKDIIEDRNHMEKDGVLTFENFKFFESDEFKVSNLKECLYKGIEKSDLKMEKIIADIFDTDLGSIDIVDADKHIFNVNDWNGKDTNVIIYSKEDLELIKTNIIDCLYEELKCKKVLLGGLIEISLKDLTSDIGYIRFAIGNELKLNEVISHLMEMEHYKSYNDYQIWIEKESSLEDYQ
jgi:hypothetical protein